MGSDLDTQLPKTSPFSQIDRVVVESELARDVTDPGGVSKTSLLEKYYRPIPNKVL
jgi:hypothetical protein